MADIITEENDIKLEGEPKRNSSPNKQPGGDKNWRDRSRGRGSNRSRGSSRGRSSGRGRGDQHRQEGNRESALNYYSNEERKRGANNDAKWSKDSEQGSEIGSEDTGFRNRTFTDRIEEKINYQSGPTYELPPLDTSEKKFNGRNRLYIANTGPEVTDEDISTLFRPYGETEHIFINKEKKFAFITLDYHANALKAKNELDGTFFKGRNLKIRLSSSNATIKVKNLGPMVTNELLYHAFSYFGEIEEAKISVDHYGKPTGEGLVHFTRKTAATTAVKKCGEGCYFVTTTLQPVIAEIFDFVDDNAGYPEKMINKNNEEFAKERKCGPRFARPDSFDFEYGQRWKALLELYTQKERALKNELHMEKEKLEAQMEYAKFEHETEMLRNTLRARELDKERQKKEWELKQRQAEEYQAKNLETMRRYQEQVEARMTTQRDDLRRKEQESNLFRQAHTLDSLLDQTERVFDTGLAEKPMDNSDNRERFGFSERVQEKRPGTWVNENAGDSYYPTKRHRF